MLFVMMGAQITLIVYTLNMNPVRRPLTIGHSYSRSHIRGVTKAAGHRDASHVEGWNEREESSTNTNAMYQIALCLFVTLRYYILKVKNNYWYGTFQKIYM
jgi:hypothetical protein